VTGYDEAKAWVHENASEWRIVTAETRLVPGTAAGAPTGVQSEVTLVEWSAFPGEGTWLKGEGETLLAAVQNAVGGHHATIEKSEPDATSPSINPDSAQTSASSRSGEASPGSPV